MEGGSGTVDPSAVGLRVSARSDPSDAWNPDVTNPIRRRTQDLVPRPSLEEDGSPIGPCSVSDP